MSGLGPELLTGIAPPPLRVKRRRAVANTRSSQLFLPIHRHAAPYASLATGDKASFFTATVSEAAPEIRVALGSGYKGSGGDKVLYTGDMGKLADPTKWSTKWPGANMQPVEVGW